MATLKRMTIDYQALALFCVDYYDKFSNFFEDLLRLDKFSESIEDELLKMWAGGRERPWQYHK